MKQLFTKQFFVKQHGTIDPMEGPFPMRDVMKPMSPIKLSLRRLALASLAVALIALIAGPALAGERLRFKNGHHIVVKSIEVDGQVVRAVMPDGSTMSFPKSLIAEVESGKKLQRAPRAIQPRGVTRTPDIRESVAYQNAVRAAGKGSRVIAAGEMPSIQDGSQPLTVGFGKRGRKRFDTTAGQARDTISVSDLGRRMKSQRTGKTGDRAGARTLAPDPVAGEATDRPLLAIKPATPKGKRYQNKN